MVNAKTKVVDVIDDPLFEGYGRLIFPTAFGRPSDSMTFDEVGSLLLWHTYVNTDTTVDVIRTMQKQRKEGRQIFYDIYTEEEKRRDPDKRDTGLFFFRGERNAPFAVVCAGGGFYYVGSVHESLPHALELSRRGYHGFALVYRTRTADAACELVSDVVDDPDFEGFGQFLFPLNGREPDEDMTLDEIESMLPYHNYVNTETTVDVIDSMKEMVRFGETIFYDIYSEEEKQADPSKEDTGLFLFRGEADAPFAVVSAGGGFSYVGSIHESFPHALELSRRGYNAFALQYRTGGADVACEDLAAAITFIFEHAGELGVSTDCYSLWGGSAGARMAAYLGSYGPEAYGGEDLPRPGAVIMQYTGHTDYTENDPPTYACVGENDGIANWHTMEQRIENLEADGIETEFHHYPDLQHGFGLGIGTSAEGWIDDAVDFWQEQIGK